MPVSPADLKANPFGTILAAINQGSGVSTTSITYEIIFTSITGRNRYYIPVGNMFLDAASESEFFIDQGSGYNQQFYGPDYSHARRTGDGTPLSVNDAAIGVSVDGGAVSAGWFLKFSWIERRLLIDPPSIAKVRVPADYTISWQSNSITPPNGVRIPNYQGTQVEFWRQTKRDGGQRGNLLNPGVITREGRRYLPYYRGPVDQFIFDTSEFAATQTRARRHFRVCYYDPTTGARSGLSNDIIVVCNDMQNDRVNGRTTRKASSVWIE